MLVRYLKYRDLSNIISEPILLKLNALSLYQLEPKKASNKPN